MVRDVFRLAKGERAASCSSTRLIRSRRRDLTRTLGRTEKSKNFDGIAEPNGWFRPNGKRKKSIMATNRADTLDPALLRPGRLDRKIEFPNPDRRQKRLVFQVCTAKMNLSDEVDLEDYVSRPDKISAADIRSICQEAGLQAVRKNRYVVMPKDFEKAYKVSVRKPGDDFEFYK